MARLFVHASVCLALAACAGCATSRHPTEATDMAGSGPADMPGSGALSVTPDPIVVVTSGTQQTVPLTVTSLLAGTPGTVTGSASFTLADPSVGQVSGGVLAIKAGLTRGEQTSLTVSYGGHSVTVPVTITLIAADILTSQAPANASAYFGGGSGGPQPAWLYPYAGAMMPPNFGLMTFQWSGPPGVTPLVQRLQLQCPTYQQTVYLGPSACATVNGGAQCQFAPTQAQWQDLTYSCAGSAVSLTVTTSPGIGMMVGSDGPRTLNIAPEDLSGAMYYLNPSSNTIYRMPAGANAPVAYIKSGNGAGCAGCHALSRDGSMFAAGFTAMYEGGGDPLGLVNGKNGETWLIKPPGLGTYDFPVFSPDGSMLMVNSLGNLAVLDTANGSVLYTVPTAFAGGRLAQPDWSPDGMTLALVQTPVALGPDYQLNTVSSSIVTMPFNKGMFSLPTPVVSPTAGKECNFYPAFSPDSQWILYNSAPLPSGGDCTVIEPQNSSLQIAGAQLDATPVALFNAMQAQNTNAKYPRFVPYPQNNGRLLFFTFSSQLAYGFLEPMNINSPTSQIWMAAIDLDKLSQPGVDPSYAPFWIPGQSLTSSNFAAQWTANVACLSSSDCPANYTCTSGVCQPLLQ